VTQQNIVFDIIMTLAWNVGSMLDFRYFTTQPKNNKRTTSNDVRI